MINSSPKTGSREDKSDAKRRDLDSPVSSPPADSKSSGNRKDSTTSKGSPPSNEDNTTNPKTTSQAEAKETPKPKATSKDEVVATDKIPSTTSTVNRDVTTAVLTKPSGDAPVAAESPAKPRFRSSVSKNVKSPTSPENVAEPSENIIPEVVPAANGPIEAAPVASPPTTSASVPAASEAPTVTDPPATLSETVQQKKGFLSGISNFMSYKKKASPKAGGPSSPPSKDKVSSPTTTVPEAGKPAASTAAAPSAGTSSTVQPAAAAAAAAAAGKGSSPDKAAPTAAASTTAVAAAGPSAAEASKSPDTTKGTTSSPPEGKKPPVVVPPLQLNSTTGGPSITSKPENPTTTTTGPSAAAPTAAAPAGPTPKEAVGSPPVTDKKKTTPEKTTTSTSAAPAATTAAPTTAAAPTAAAPTAAAPTAAAPTATADKAPQSTAEQPGKKAATAAPAAAVAAPAVQEEVVQVTTAKPSPKVTDKKTAGGAATGVATPATPAPASVAAAGQPVEEKGTTPAAAATAAPAQPAASSTEKSKPEDKPVGIADPKTVKTGGSPDKKQPSESPVTVAVGGAAPKETVGSPPVNDKKKTTPEKTTTTATAVTPAPAAAAAAVVPASSASATTPATADAKPEAGAKTAAAVDEKTQQPHVEGAPDKVEEAAHMLLGHQRVVHTATGIAIDTTEEGLNEHKDEEKGHEEGKHDEQKLAEGTAVHHTTHVETTTDKVVDEAAHMLLSGRKSPRAREEVEGDKKEGEEHHSFFDNDNGGGEVKPDGPPTTATPAFAAAIAAAAGKQHKTNHDHARDIDHPMLNDSKEHEEGKDVTDSVEIRRTKHESEFESWDNAAESSIYRHVDKAVPKIREQFDYSLGDGTGRQSVFRRNRQKARNAGDIGGKSLPVVKTPDQSALKIQTVFRGKKVRKHRRLQVAAITCIQRLYRGVLSRKKFVNDVLALKIKARADKERKKRLLAIKSKERDMMLLNSIPADEYLSYERIKKNNSAKLIQKNWRAKYTAMTGKAPPSMADVVQRATAGMLAHRYPHDLHKKRVAPLKEGGTRSVLTGLKEDNAAKAKRNSEKEEALAQQRRKIFEYMKRMRGSEDILVARAAEQNIPYVPHTVEAVYSPDVDALGLAQLHRRIKDAAQQKSKEREQRADKLGFRHRSVNHPTEPSLGAMSEDEVKDSTRSSARTVHRDEVLQHQKQMNDRGGARRKYQDLREAQQRASILMQEYSYAQPSMQARQTARQQTLGNCQYLLETLKNPPSLDDAKTFIQALEKEQTSGMHSSNLSHSLSAAKPTAAQMKAERERLDQAHKWFHDDVVDYSFFQLYQKTHAVDKAVEAGKDPTPIEARFGQTQLEKVVDTHLRTLEAVKDKNNWGVVAIPLNVALPSGEDAVLGGGGVSQADEVIPEVQVNVSLNRSMEGFTNALTHAKSTKNALKRETKVFRHLDSNWVKGTDAEDSLYWISYATQPSKVSLSSLTPSDVVTARQKQVIVANRKGGVTNEPPVPTSDAPKVEEGLAPTSLQLLEKHAELLKEVSVEAMNHPKRKQAIAKYCKTENDKIDRLAGVFQQEAVSLIKREYSIKSGKIASKEQRHQQMKAVALIQSLFRGKRARRKAAAIRTQQRVLAALQNLLTEISNSDSSKQRQHASHHLPPPGSRYGAAAVSESVDHTGPIMDYVSKIPHLQGLLVSPAPTAVQTSHSANFTGKETVQSAARFARAATAAEPVENVALKSPYMKSSYNLQPVATPATPHLMEHFQSVPNTGATPFVTNPGSSILKNAWAPPTPSNRSSNLAAASVGINYVDGGGLSRVPSTDRDLRSSSIGTPRATSYSTVGQFTPRTGGGVPEDLAGRLPVAHPTNHPSTTAVGGIVPMSPFTPTVPEGSKHASKTKLSPRANNTIPSGQQLRRSEEAESPRGAATTPHTPGTDDKSMLSEFSYSEAQTGYISSPSQSHSSLSHSNSFSVPNNKLPGKKGGSNNRLSKHSEEDSHLLEEDEGDDDDPHEIFTGSLSSKFSPYKNSPRKTDLSEGKGGDLIEVKRKFQIGAQSSAKVAQTMFMVEQQFKNKTTAVNSFIQSALGSQITNFDRLHAMQMMTDITRVTGVAPLSQWLFLFKQSVAAAAVSSAAGASPTSSTDVRSNEMPVESGAILLSSLASEFGLMGSKDGAQSEKALFAIIQTCMLLRLLGSGNESGNLKISEVASIVEDAWLQDVRNQGNSNAGVKLMWQLAQIRANVLQQATKKGGMNPRTLLDETVGVVLATAGNPGNLKSTVGGTLTVTDNLELDKQTLVQLVHQFSTTEDNEATLELVENLIKLCKWSDKITSKSSVTVLELKDLLCTLCSYRNIQRRIEIWYRAVPTMHQSLLDAIHTVVPAKDSLVSTDVFCQACQTSNMPLSFSESFMLAQLLTRKAKTSLLSGVSNAMKNITGSGDKNAAGSAHSSVSSSYNREGWHVDISLLLKIKKGEYLNAVMS